MAIKQGRTRNTVHWIFSAFRDDTDYGNEHFVGKDCQAEEDDMNQSIRVS